MNKEGKSSSVSNDMTSFSAPNKRNNILKVVSIGLISLSLALSTVALIVTLMANKNGAVTHLVSFRNYDNALIATETIKDGEVATKPDITPTKPADSVNTYSFSGWDKEFTTTIKEDTTFSAQYTATPIPVITPTPTYTVRFLNDDTGKSVLYSCSIKSGEKASYQGVTPTKEADSQYSYSFKGWDTDPATVTITANKDFTAQYNKTAIVAPATTYTVRFLNSDDSILYSCLVKSGEKASYQGVIPTKTADSQYTYAFKGWDVVPSTVTITENKDFKAQYNQTAIPLPGVTYYNVVFRNGSVAYNTQSVAKGGYASVPATNPTKESDENGSYTFSGWDHDPASTIINGYTEFNAIYNNTPITTYNVRFLNYDDTVLYTETIASGNKASYGSTVPTKAATTEVSYKFAVWDKDIGAAIIANTDFKATYDTYYQATFLDEDGTFLDRQEIKEGSHASTSVVPTKSNFEFTTYSFSTWKDKTTGIEASNLVMSKNVTFVATYLESEVTTSGLILTPDNASSPTYYSVTAYNGTDDYVIIPETASDGKPVTHIAESSFTSNTYVTNIKGNSITAIDNASSETTGAFEEASNLLYVSFPELTTLGDYAFYKCPIVKDFNIPKVTSIGKYALSECQKLPSIYLPSIVAINDYAFNLDFLLTEITGGANSSLISIGSYAFWSCGSLSTLPSTLNVTNISDWAFGGCFSFYKAYFPANSITIGSGAFYNCQKLLSVAIPNLTAIPDSTFSLCTNLKSLDMPNVTTIGNDAFNWDSSLKSINFPLVTSVGTKAFKFCSSLSSISLPKVTSIDGSPFSECGSISYIAINDLTILNKITSNSLVVGQVKCDSTSAVDIPDNAFKNFSSFYSFVATNSVKSFGKYSFYNSQLETIPTISSISCNIGAFAFGKCTHIESIKLNGTSTLTVYEDAFAGIGYIDELTLPLNTTFNNSNSGDEYKIARYNPFLGDSFGSVTFAGNKAQFSAIQTRDAPKFGLTSLFPVGTTINCSDGSVSITA